MIESEEISRLSKLKRTEKRLWHELGQAQSGIAECHSNLANNQRRQLAATGKVEMNEYTPPDVKKRMEIRAKRGGK